ncbi:MULTISPECIES: DUF2750 domain-containing protein [Staphylococcus]|uniref:DUF2750 domain-containing protein n=1 Tax=Staphylococcus agnetis TaxID=985762 RepID=A0ABX3Z303_9STAP|nr:MULTISPECIES: DUF2750 domain-containing protein [Staphylococcus]MBY7665009.1 DUF2750 domain-containing protein [Staphylococcus agnetis]MCO4326213.1 DUF2750 domain-containing protein [Staphylococcus agnetis]MCO4338736.1 DUF2750 domain-containing protein [Staphylococcus agnetis]MCO4340545.1 DUF2750 domain-containing protein [Staphylococcus agnetis]MCO4343598.1 DUF2750 domain-containing protein [Staphylococcus agnetis]
MSYKNERFYKDILTNEQFFIAVKDKKIVKHLHNGKQLFCFWTRESLAKAYLENLNVEFDKIKAMDIDRFTTYELDDMFDEEDEAVVNVTIDAEGHEIKILSAFNDIMTDIDRLRIREFVEDVSKTDTVYGLTRKGTKQFMVVSDENDNFEQSHFMPVWSLSQRAKRVAEEDFETLELIDVEGEVFSEWLDELRDDNRYVAIDLKPGVVGTIVSAQKLANELTF